MKKIHYSVGLILLLITAGKFSSQKLLSMVQQDWNGSGWTNTSILSYSYNAGQQLTLTVFGNWDDLTSSWKPASRTSSTVDVNGNPTTSLQESWDNDSNSWTPFKPAYNDLYSYE